MARTVGTKVLFLIPVLFLVSLGTFFMVSLVPGDVAVAVRGPNASADDYHRVRLDLGLNKPVLQRYGDWLGHAVRGAPDKNMIPLIKKVTTRLARPFPVNTELAVLALVMAFVIAIPLA